ncbi:heme-binding protein soul2 [Electrophorus electricus]|nr:heme-binding protein soul2 [Electrophorus electricus]
MKMIPTSALFLLWAFLALGRCWEPPVFCGTYECPVYTLKNEYEDFVERFYNATRWITADIAGTHDDDIKNGFWKVYNFMNGENKEGVTIAMTRPVVVSMLEGGENGNQTSVWIFIPPETVLPEPNDESIKHKVLPSGTFYVRVFSGQASYKDVMENRKILKEALLDAGKQFDDMSYMAAAYDAPWIFWKRHNEVLIPAVCVEAPRQL